MIGQAKRILSSQLPYLPFLFLSGWVFVVLARVFLARLRYPLDLEWMEGRGRFRMGDQDYAAEPGALLTVPAKVEHGFHGVTEDLLLLVFFAPAEGTSE